MEKPPPAPFYRADQFPADSDPFWHAIQDPNVANMTIWLMLNEIRQFDPVALNDAQCRTQLGKLKAFQQIIDGPSGMLHIKKHEDITTNEEFPS